jgi:hypothetical protein
MQFTFDFSLAANRSKYPDVANVDNALVVVAVTDHFVIGERRSSIVVRLVDSLKKSKPNIEAKYDLASLGEVESITGPFDDPPTWMVSYKESVLAKAGDRINQKPKTAEVAAGPGYPLYHENGSRRPTKNR